MRYAGRPVGLDRPALEASRRGGSLAIVAAATSQRIRSARRTGAACCAETWRRGSRRPAPDPRAPAVLAARGLLRVPGDRNGADRRLPGLVRMLVHPGGLEPPTFWSVARRSIQLSYGCPSRRRRGRRKGHWILDQGGGPARRAGAGRRKAALAPAGASPRWRARAGAGSARAIRSSRARSDRSAHDSRPRRRRPAPRAASGASSVSSIAAASARGVAAGDQQPVDTVADQRRHVAHRGGDHRRAAGHRLEQAVGRPFAVGGLDEDVEAAQHVLGIGAMAQQAGNDRAPRRSLRPRARRPRASRARDHQPHLGHGSPPTAAKASTRRSGASRDRAAPGCRPRSSPSPTPHSRAHARARAGVGPEEYRRRPRWAGSRSRSASIPRAASNRSRRSRRRPRTPAETTQQPVDPPGSRRSARAACAPASRARWRPGSRARAAPGARRRSRPCSRERERSGSSARAPAARSRPSVRGSNARRSSTT